MNYENNTNKMIWLNKITVAKGCKIGQITRTTTITSKWKREKSKQVELRRHVGTCDKQNWGTWGQTRLWCNDSWLNHREAIVAKLVLSLTRQNPMAASLSTLVKYVCDNIYQRKREWKEDLSIQVRYRKESEQGIVCCVPSLVFTVHGDRNLHIIHRLWKCTN